jgi:hypothetical protein
MAKGEVSAAKIINSEIFRPLVVVEESSGERSNTYASIQRLGGLVRALLKLSVVGLNTKSVYVSHAIRTCDLQPVGPSPRFLATA